MLAVCAVAIVAIYGKGPLWRWWKGRNRPAPETKVLATLADYMMACAIVNRYIDPDNTMPDGVRITTRSQFLTKFEKVVGAKVGDEYNADLLHLWLQKNAARALAKYQSEIV